MQRLDVFLVCAITRLFRDWLANYIEIWVLNKPVKVFIFFIFDSQSLAHFSNHLLIGRSLITVGMQIHCSQSRQWIVGLRADQDPTKSVPDFSRLISQSKCRIR